MNFRLKNILAGGALALLFSNCQDVIDVNLDDAEQQIVIEGILTDQPGKHRVRITKSIPFDEPNQYPAVAGAFVTIADDAGLLDTLLETSPGIFETQKIGQAIAGRTYTLRVEAEGKIFSANSTMPTAVPFDKLTTNVVNFGGEPSINLVPEFADPPGLGNFYNFTIYKNGERQPEIYTLSDDLSDGNRLTRPLLNPDLDLKTGDSCTVEMFCLNETEFKYLLTLQLIAGNGPGGGTTPSNPDNNFGGACLGHFSAQTVRIRSILIP